MAAAPLKWRKDPNGNYTARLGGVPLLINPEPKYRWAVGEEIDEETWILTRSGTAPRLADAKAAAEAEARRMLEERDEPGTAPTRG